MTSILADMRDCYRADFEPCLPEYPTTVSEDEISFLDGKDDYGRYMIGCLFEPKYPDVALYMDGWNWARENSFGEFAQIPSYPQTKIVAGANFVLLKSA